ncbi:hypothetical protein AB0H92_10955 [Streptomyces phaeochromogenes]|uniref:hypothetical protein n=1 Tax=Streptomyces phaeochromogenes TaxID=1923 RepID=UPI0033D1CD5F
MRVVVVRQQVPEAGLLQGGSHQAVDERATLTFWRAAVMLEECIVLRPFPAGNELYGYGVALAYLGMRGEQVNTKFEAWRELIADIRALKLDSYGIAERHRSLRVP